MYADAALEAGAAANFEQHLESCAACRTRVAELRAERLALRTALLDAPDEAPVPAFAPPRSSHAHTVGLLAALLAAAGASAFWQSLAAAVPVGLRWLNPFQTGELFERALNLATFVIYEGSTMWSTLLDFVGAALIVALVAWGAAALVRQRAGTAALLSVLALAIALPTLGHALEIRRGEGLVSLAAGETIDDTLIAAGETVAIDGDVNGDLLAFGRSVIVRGNVAGNLITGAETITIEGTVGGSILSGGRGITLGARVARNLYSFGRDIEIEANGDIAGNAMTFGQRIDIDGRVGIDVKAFGETVAVSGNVVRDVEVYGASVTLLPSARIGRNVTTHTDEPSAVQIASGAVVGGAVDRQVVERERRRNEYLTVGYYVGQVVRLGAAFLTGLLLFWMFPALRTLSLPDVGTGLRSAGIGLATAVTLPIAALIACLTVVGMPIGIAAFVLGALGLYFAKTVVAQLIGRRLFRGPTGEPHYAVTLLAGLAIVMIAINIPFIGGLLNLAATLVGLGMIVTVLYARFSRGPDL
jgi:cytoskeletal protein CcmA (bactofilin family)